MAYYPSNICHRGGAVYLYTHITEPQILGGIYSTILANISTAPWNQKNCTTPYNKIAL